MGEGQSRYGIMEELNNRKIKEKEKLANIERELDNKEYEDAKSIEVLRQEIVDQESTYEFTHKDKVRNLDVNAKLLDGQYERAKTTLINDIKDEKNNYKSRFADWKTNKLKTISACEEELDRYSEIQNKKIAEKKEVIVEIENGIASLKEISAEQKEKETKSK